MPGPAIGDLNGLVRDASQSCRPPTRSAGGIDKSAFARDEDVLCSSGATGVERSSLLEAEQSIKDTKGREGAISRFLHAQA